MNDSITPEKQTLAKCAELRQQCRESIFEKMDNQHETVMTAIGKVDKGVAFMKGQMKGNPKPIPVTNSCTKNGKWKEVFIKIFIAWGPWIMFFLGLGIYTFLKSKGWI